MRVRGCLSAFLFGLTSAAQLNPVHAPVSRGHQPYMAEFKVTQVQTLANGVTITRESTEIHAVDSQGRTMTSTTVPLSAADQQPSAYGHVFNPADGTQISWDSRSKQVRILKEPVGDQRKGCWESDSGRMHMSFSSGQPRGSDAENAEAPGPRMEHAKPQSEDLGTATIQGIEARGTRTTWTTPTGQVGNDAPLVRVSENWCPTRLGLLLREVSDDPRSGKTDRELETIDLGEPAASTFQPPDGYKVVTEELHPVPCQQ